MPETADEEEAVDKSQELDEVNDDPDEVLCGYCGEHWPFPDSKCHCGFTIKTSRCKIKCDRPDNLAKPWWIIGNEIYLDTIVNIDEGIEAFEEPDEANRDHIDNMDECIEGFVERDDIDRNLSAKTDVAEIAVDTADLDPEDIEAMQFVKQFIEKNPENIDALMLANTILRAMELMNGKMIKRAPLMTYQMCDLKSIANEIKTELINALCENSCP